MNESQKNNPVDPTLNMGPTQPSAKEIADANNREIGSVVGNTPESEKTLTQEVKSKQQEGLASSRMEDIPGMRVDQDLTPDGMILSTKKILESEPRLPLFIPLDPGEKMGAYKTASINGYRFDIKKNTMVFVPKSIQELIMNSMGAVIQATLENPANLESASDDRRRALNAG